ncbi:Rangdp-Nup153znf34 complex [Schizophyllum commune]
MVPNKAEVTKCVACDELKPGAASDGAPKPVGGFNWAAAGMKKPETMGWTCSTCMLPNKGEATQCVACEEPKP